MRREIFSVLFALVLLTSFSLVTATPAAAQETYYVSTEGSDDYGNGTETWVDNDLDEVWSEGDTGPWLTIQHAVDTVQAGDTISVAAGEYAGAVIDKAVTVSGVEGGASVITSGVQYRAGNDNLQTAFRPEADGAEIRNFTINCGEDPDLGVYARGVDGVIVDSLIINTDGTVQGITNWGGSNWVITHNVITNTVAAGGGGIGIFLGAMPPNQYSESTELRVCAGNLIQFNTIAATATAETYSCAGIAGCLDTRYGGYDALDDSEDVSGNQILDNVITSTGVNNAVGIEVGTILGNSEDDPLRTDSGAIAALMAAGAVHDNVVQGNNIDGAETGVYFYNVTDLTITQNGINNSVDKGIYAEHAHSGTVIQANDFADNAIQVLDEVEALVIGDVLANNTFDRAVVIDRPEGSLLHTIWSKIQDAVDAADPGDTISVAAGTYDEEVVIDKSLTLISDTGDYRTTGVILNGPIALNNVVNVTIQGFKFQDCSSSGYKHVIYTGGTADNITIAANSFESCEGLNIHIYYLDTWFENWTITGNKITNVTGDKASGIWVQRLRNSTISNNEISNTTYAGMILDRIENVTVSNNNISDTPQKGIQVATSQDCNVVIKDNYITNTNTSHDADEGAITIYPDVTNIRIENNTLTANYQGFTVRDKAGTVSDVYVNFNNIYVNDGFGVGNFAQGGGTVDATNNYWGDISGPQHETMWGDYITNPGGTGDSVSDYVNYMPWLTRDFQTVLDDNIAYFGFPMVWLNTGWNTFSTPIALDPACDTWAEYVELGDGLSTHDTSPAYAFNGENQDWVPLIGDDADYPLTPCDAIYVKMAEPDIAAILLSPNVSVPSKDLYAGWNLVSLARLVGEGGGAMPARMALATVSTVTGDLTGWDLVVSPPVNQQPWSYLRVQMSPAPPMEITRGYWVFMINDGTLAGFTFTPISLAPPEEP